MKTLHPTLILSNSQWGNSTCCKKKSKCILWKTDFSIDFTAKNKVGDRGNAKLEASKSSSKCQWVTFQLLHPLMTVPMGKGTVGTTWLMYTFLKLQTWGFDGFTMGPQELWSSCVSSNKFPMEIVDSEDNFDVVEEKQTCLPQIFGLKQFAVCHSQWEVTWLIYLSFHNKVLHNEIVVTVYCETHHKYIT